VWRAADGPKPGATYLSPAEAGDELNRLLAGAPREPTDPRHKRDQDRTFGEACDTWLDYIEHEKALRPSTVRDYRNAVGCYLLPEFGTTTLLRTIDTRRIDAYRERLLTEGELSRRTIQKILVQLYSILKRAKRKGWIDANPAEDAERVTVRRTGDFTVLCPDEVHAVARADGSELYGAIYVTAAFTGLRVGELRALRWLDVDFPNRIVHVRRNHVRDAHGAPKAPARSQCAHDRPGRRRPRRPQPSRPQHGARGARLHPRVQRAVPSGHRAQALLRRARARRPGCAPREERRRSA